MHTSCYWDLRLTLCYKLRISVLWSVLLHWSVGQYNNRQKCWHACCQLLGEKEILNITSAGWNIVLGHFNMFFLLFPSQIHRNLLIVIFTRWFAKLGLNVTRQVHNQFQELVEQPLLGFRIAEEKPDRLKIFEWMLQNDRWMSNVERQTKKIWMSKMDPNFFRAL